MRVLKVVHVQTTVVILIKKWVLKCGYFKLSQIFSCPFWLSQSTLYLFYSTFIIWFTWECLLMDHPNKRVIHGLTQLVIGDAGASQVTQSISSYFCLALYFSDFFYLLETVVWFLSQVFCEINHFCNNVKFYS